MIRASFPQRHGHGLAVLLGCALLAACQKDPGTGPVQVKWDRDTCERCRMVVSDRKYAAQVRGGPKRKAHHFDDIGCAVFWLKDQPWGREPGVEIWVTDYRGGQWLDATQACYVGGKTTPMYYGYGASAEPVPGCVSFEDMRREVLARGR